MPSSTATNVVQPAGGLATRPRQRSGLMKPPRSSSRAGKTCRYAACHVRSCTSAIPSASPVVATLTSAGGAFERLAVSGHAGSRTPPERRTSGSRRAPSPGSVPNRLVRRPGSTSRQPSTEGSYRFRRRRVPRSAGRRIPPRRLHRSPRRRGRSPRGARASSLARCFAALDAARDDVPVASLLRRTVHEEDLGPTATRHEHCDLRAGSHRRESRAARTLVPAIG